MTDTSFKLEKSLILPLLLLYEIHSFSTLREWTFLYHTKERKIRLQNLAAKECSAVIIICEFYLYESLGIGTKNGQSDYTQLRKGL